MLDVNLFLSFISFAIMLGVVGLWKRIPLMMLVAGALISFLAVTEGQTLTQGNRVESIDEDGLVTWQEDPANMSVFPMIFFGLMGSMFLIAGALVWKYEED